MKPKWLYRLESTDKDNGLWYNSKGEFCFEKGIGSLDDSCKTKSLQMGYDERYRQDGKMWFSSCSNQEDLTHWYSKEDAEELINKGFVSSKTNTDIELPQGLKTDGAKSFNKTIEEILKSGDLSKLIEQKDLILG
jgi:hypothetical protein